jgi:hypothetical protein
MLKSWKSEWNARPLNDFKKVSDVLTKKNLSDLPGKEVIQEVRNTFIFVTEGAKEGLEGLELLKNAILTLDSFDRTLVRPPSLSKRRLLGLRGTGLKAELMYECSWLQELFGENYSLEIQEIGPEDTPPMDEPIVVVMRPYTRVWAELLESWDKKGAKYYILHLSDEHAQDNIAMYHSPNCLGVVRNYIREDLEGLAEKVAVIPLGYHWSKRTGIEDPELQTPRLPFRELVWSFHGTDWNGRSESMKNLQLLQPNKLQWFKEWNDAQMLGKQEYLDILMNSRFVPVPGGQNPETYRFYEALECGCVPVYVRQDGDDGFLNKQVRRFLPLPDFPTWDHATAFIYELSNNVQALEGFRSTCLNGWKAWKEESKRDVRRIFKV